MNEFDSKAREWDSNIIHVERSIAIAQKLQEMLPLSISMKSLEYGTGTGMLSFLLKDRFAHITLMDSSKEMIKVCNEKTEFFKTTHIHPVLFDLEHNNYNETFDIIYNQMVMHHIDNIENILAKFYSMLNAGGYLAIADLFAEDGAFHGNDAIIHKGFDPNELIKTLKTIGFRNGEFETSYVIKRESKEFPVFLLTAQK